MLLLDGTAAWPWRVAYGLDAVSAIGQAALDAVRFMV